MYVTGHCSRWAWQSLYLHRALHSRARDRAWTRKQKLFQSVMRTMMKTKQSKGVRRTGGRSGCFRNGGQRLSCWGDNSWALATMWCEKQPWRSLSGHGESKQEAGDGGENWHSRCILKEKQRRFSKGPNVVGKGKGTSKDDYRVLHKVPFTGYH